VKKILIVDDSLFMRKVLSDLMPKDCQVIEAESGAAALQLFKKEKPDLILLDIVMQAGEEEGVKALEGIMKANPEAQVVMITAVGQDAIMATCKKLGAADYVVKPFDEVQVLSTVEECLGHARAGAGDRR
jgi:two-component system chemotaxis response regulator CheY